MCGRVGGGNNKTALSSVGRGAVLEILWAKHPREFDSRRCLPSEPGDPAGDGAGFRDPWGQPHAVFDPQVRHDSLFFLLHPRLFWSFTSK